MSAQFYSVHALTLVATGVIAANRFVTFPGTQTVADANAIGVTRTAAAIGDAITVDALGTAVVESGAAVAAGDTVKSDATGRAITWAAAGAKLGQALQAATAAGQFIEVRLVPNVV
jgi:uncharacterized protein DUF2190